jgi:hypothetical protein
MSRFTLENKPLAFGAQALVACGIYGDRRA